MKLKLITTNSFEMSIIMLKILENTKSADTSINNVECTTNVLYIISTENYGTNCFSNRSFTSNNNLMSTSQSIFSHIE